MDSGNGNAVNAHDPSRPNPISYATPGVRPDLPFKDQRGGMKTMGVVLVVLGCFSGCLAIGTPAAMFVPRLPGQPAPQLRDLIGGMILYAVGAVVLVTLGAGSLRIRRWSRPIVMIVSGTGAVLGLAGLIFYMIMGPKIAQAMAVAAANAAATTAPTGPGGAPAPMPQVGLIASGCFMLVFMVVLPAGFFFFYKRDSVQQTLDYFDPNPTWTDRCPTPVLAVSLWLLAEALVVLTYCAWGIFPAFGVLLTGALARGLLVLVAVVMGILAWGVYRVSAAAWWATALGIVLGVVTMATTFTRIDPMEMHRLMGMAPEQIEMMRQMGLDNRLITMLPPVLYGAAVLIYMLWARKFLRTRTIPTDRAAPPV